MKGSRFGAAFRAQRILMTGISPMAMLVMSGAAYAQQAPEAKADDQPAIVVTGIRGSLTKASEIKRKSEVVMDSLSAEDIGALPDRSVSEALQRVPGVTLQRTDDNRDPARLSGEGGGVFVRGLSWVRTELNGRDTFSANNGRSLNFEDVSADLLAGIDVIKNPSADMVEGGVGGTVNLRTRKPLDEKKQIIAVSGDYNYADLRKTGFWSGNAMYSNRWDVGEVEMGLLLSASLSNNGNRSDAIQLGPYGAVTPTATTGNMVSGQTYYIPSSIGWREVDWTQKRTAYDAVFQVRPFADLTLTAEGFISKATPHEIEHTEGVYTLPSTSSTYTFNNQNVLTGGSYSAANMDLDTRASQRDSVTRDYSLKMEYRIDRHWHVNADIQRVASETRSQDFTAYTEFGTSDTSYTSANRPTINFNLGGNTPYINTVANSGYALSDPSQYWWAAAMDHIEHNSAYSWAEKADVEYDFDEGSALKSLQFGLRHTDKSSITRQTNWNWSLLSHEFWGGGNAVYVPSTGGAEQFSFNNFMRGSVNMPGVGWFPSVSLMNQGNVGAYNSLLQSIETTAAAGWGWSPLTDASYANATPGSDNPTAGIVNQNEKTWAGYAMARFDAEQTPLGHVAGNFGVRVVHTGNATNGLVNINNPTNTYAGCVTSVTAEGGIPATACAPLAGRSARVSIRTTTPMCCPASICASS